MHGFMPCSALFCSASDVSVNKSVEKYSYAGSGMIYERAIGFIEIRRYRYRISVYCGLLGKLKFKRIHRWTLMEDILKQFTKWADKILYTIVDGSDVERTAWAVIVSFCSMQNFNDSSYFYTAIAMDVRVSSHPT